jgi:hypothetical protein
MPAPASYLHDNVLASHWEINMPLTPAEIEVSYRLALERTPSPQEVTNIINQHSTLEPVRQILLNSEEFYSKFNKMRASFEDRQIPILVHIDSPETRPERLAQYLDDAVELEPGHEVDPAGFEAICAMPRPERLKIRYIRGNLGINAGEALNLPWRRLCVLRQPGQRIFQLYCTAKEDTPNDADDMSFGTYLEYSLQSVTHRTELDNGQVRRLAGRTTPDWLGQESLLLRHALHAAMDPNTILGFFEQPDLLIQTLNEHGGVKRTAPESSSISSTIKGYDNALNKLSVEHRLIFNGYTAWDNYLYDVCMALISSKTN